MLQHKFFPLSLWLFKTLQILLVIDYVLNVIQHNADQIKNPTPDFSRI